MHEHNIPIWGKIFWIYGYIDAFSKPFSRKNRISQKVYYYRYNETFMRHDWVEINEKYKYHFKCQR